MTASIYYRATINEPGKDPQTITCCRECGTAIQQRNEKQLPKQAKNEELLKQLQRQLPDQRVEIPKPERVREVPSVERSIGLKPPGYKPS